eukprot:TRINITY_DN105489_c0_g1_i1.p1 TRINITY_DN105489_c0_g1~~TRINITY_DN105489_c0_g1_i1.p1  ORF type:complete len:190 (+),score=4.88 TRINITY_DN105489_c0_g1_i1:75-644(+)
MLERLWFMAVSPPSGVVADSWEQIYFSAYPTSNFRVSECPSNPQTPWPIRQEGSLLDEILDRGTVRACAFPIQGLDEAGVLFQDCTPTGCDPNTRDQEILRLHVNAISAAYNTPLTIENVMLQSSQACFEGLYSGAIDWAPYQYGSAGAWTPYNWFGYPKKGRFLEYLRWVGFKPIRVGENWLRNHHAY